MRKNFTRILFSLLLGILVLGTFIDNADAKPRRRGPVSPAIPEEQRPFGALPWIVGIGMGAVTVFVSLKPAKRTHMD